jgi:hypothetical protein
MGGHMKPNLQLIYPMFALVLLTFCVMLLSFRQRVNAVKKGMSARYFKTYTEGTAPESLIKTDRHFINLFEVPVLFYAGCLAAMMVPVTGPVVLATAWLFVAARVVHAYIHIGPNKIFPRMSIHMVACATVLALWIQIVIAI